MSDPHSPNVPDIEPDFVEDPSPRPRADAPARRSEKAAARGASVAGSSASSAMPGGEPRHRPGECVPNVPDVPPETLDAGEEERLAAAAAPPPEPPEPDGSPFPRWIRWGYFATSLAVVALFGVFVFSQAISALSQAATLPEWQRYLLLIPLGLSSVLLLLVAASLVWSWLRLRAIRQIDLAALNDLKNRAETRRDGVEQFQQARRSLEDYVTKYPLAGPNKERLRRAGLADEPQAAMMRDREYLLSREGDSHGWLGDYRELFQKPLDKAAAARVNSWSLKAAGCVIASPLPLLDAILVLAISFRMIKDLCVLYNVRTGGAASFLLFTRAIRNAFIAGLADEAGSAAGEMIGEEMSSILGEGAMGTLGASFVRVAAPKLGEGALNGLFMRRLGKATVRLLQPLRG